MGQVVTVVIIDDSLRARQTVRKELARYPEVALVAEGEAGEDIFPIIRVHTPDVLLLDMDMPQSKQEPAAGMYSSLSAISYLSEKYPDMTIIIHTHNLDPVMVRYTTTTGARGYFFKLDGGLENAIGTIAGGKIYPIYYAKLWQMVEG